MTTGPACVAAAVSDGPGQLEAAVQQHAGRQLPGDRHRGTLERRRRAQQSYEGGAALPDM